MLPPHLEEIVGRIRFREPAAARVRLEALAAEGQKQQRKLARNEDTFDHCQASASQRGRFMGSPPLEAADFERRPSARREGVPEFRASVGRVPGVSPGNIRLLRTESRIVLTGAPLFAACPLKPAGRRGRQRVGRWVL